MIVFENNVLKFRAYISDSRHFQPVLGRIFLVESHFEVKILFCLIPYVCLIRVFFFCLFKTTFMGEFWGRISRCRIRIWRLKLPNQTPGRRNFGKSFRNANLGFSRILFVLAFSWARLGCGHGPRCATTAPGCARSCLGRHPRSQSIWLPRATADDENQRSTKKNY